MGGGDMLAARGRLLAAAGAGGSMVAWIGILGINSVGTGTIFTPGPDTADAAALGGLEPIVHETRLGLRESSCRRSRCWRNVTTSLGGMSIASSPGP